MEPENEEKIMNEKLQERFKALPKALQNAITSVEVEEKLRGLSDTHKLHLDQWQKLENEVMLALLGFQPVENLEANIKKEVRTSDERSKILATDIAETIFQPIRAELERELGKPKDEPVASSPQPVARDSAGQEAGSPEGQQAAYGAGLQPVEKPAASSLQPVARSESPISPEHASAQKIIEALPPRPVAPTAPPPAPVASTPPHAPPTAKSVRATLSPAYAPDTKSHERLAIDDDPYREPTA